MRRRVRGFERSAKSPGEYLFAPISNFCCLRLRSRRISHSKHSLFPRRRESSPSSAYFQWLAKWIPAFAGITTPGRGSLGDFPRIGHNLSIVKERAMRGFAFGGLIHNQRAEV
jgi:hypothetical protein